MRNTWKKTAAFLLAFTLAAVPLSQTGVKGGLFGNIGIVAHAETTVTTFDELIAAVGDDGSGGLVTLGADIVQDNGYISVDKDATLDLNGHTLSVGEDFLSVSTPAFTIKDSVGNGKYVSADTSYNILICPGASFTLESGTLEFTNSDTWGVDVYGGTFIMNGGTINSAGKSIWRDGGPVTINGGTINGEFYDEDGSMTINGGIFDFDVSSYVAAGTEMEKVGNFWGVGAKSIAELKAISITDATVNLGADNSVASITVGSNTITDLSGFDITYGVSDTDHTATSVPTDAGTYYAYVTAKESNTAYTGTAKSDSFEVAAAPTMTSASVTLNDGFGLNFYVDNITDATGYTVMFYGVCDENGTEAALTEKDGKFFATANVNAKDIKENIAATLYKDGVATDVTLTSSVDAYLTAALATDGLDDKTKALIEATQLYGCTADNYFNNAENDFNQMFGDFLTYAGLESDQTPLYAAINNAVANDNVNDEKVSLVLNSKVKLRIYSDNGTNENNYGKYSEITGLTPLTMGQNQTVGGCSVSGYTWVDRVLEQNEIDKNYYMAMALASYMYAAEKYAIVDVASVTITNAPTEAITVGNTGTLTATVSPDNATNKTVTWAVTEGEDVLSINAATGAYTALKAGTAKVTATAGGKTAECTITVIAPQPKTLTVGDYTFNYIEGQKWGEITLPASVYRSGSFICYDEYDPNLDEWRGLDLFDETTDNYAKSNDVIDSTHSYRWL